VDRRPFENESQPVSDLETMDLAWLLGDNAAHQGEVTGIVNGRPGWRVSERNVMPTNEKLAAGAIGLLRNHIAHAWLVEKLVLTGSS